LVNDIHINECVELFSHRHMRGFVSEKDMAAETI